MKSNLVQRLRADLHYLIPNVCGIQGSVAMIMFKDLVQYAHATDNDSLSVCYLCLQILVENCKKTISSISSNWWKWVLRTFFKYTMKHDFSHAFSSMFYWGIEGIIALIHITFHVKALWYSLTSCVKIVQLLTPKLTMVFLQIKLKWHGYNS